MFTNLKHSLFLSLSLPLYISVSLFAHTHTRAHTNLIHSISIDRRYIVVFWRHRRIAPGSIRRLHCSSWRARYSTFLRIRRTHRVICRRSRVFWSSPTRSGTRSVRPDRPSKEFVNIIIYMVSCLKIGKIMFYFFSFAKFIVLCYGYIHEFICNLILSLK